MYSVLSSTPVTPPAPGGKGKGGCVEGILVGECTYKARPAAKQPHQERMSRACKVVGGAQGCVPWGANGDILCTSSRSGVQEIMRTIVAVAGCVEGIQGGEYTKLGLRPSNRTKRE